MARLFIALTVVSIAAQAHSDDLYLVNGRRLRGQIVARDAHSVVIQVGPGQITLPASRIERIETGLSPLQSFNERASRLEAGDIEGWVSLALWAQERSLLTQTRQAWDHVLQIRPDHPLAHAGLGNVRHNGQWMSHDQSQRSRGLVRSRGQWVTPAEREVDLRNEVADAAARRAEAESRARIRESEARARTAEAEAAAAEHVARLPGPYSSGILGPVIGSVGALPYRAHGRRYPHRRTRPQHPAPSPPARPRTGSIR